ncbi:MAG TPA: molybdopterin-guanine dinucleotide biosynthesis protein B [Aurantimonas sp.]|uniref:Molybdopterin-guanine dinucleotide biosynthesis protein B n=1 Tax=Aurantimonas marianensis TaxID=2920428 RepID=A0A9X2HAU1_9HYPH|nr:molybdopterin-guanine dinucleotide biosynthesis protein B [Aurantimonas marianensis]MCP3054169.1 molybdopterin-guanine dinucleotide biosynthesis protein B [Aurantimonas marianensis]
MTQRLFGITGWKNSGKTTLTERLVTELTHRGYRVSTVKHAHHAFDIDTPGTDSFRHRSAGASEVAIVSSTRWALMHELRGESEPTLHAIIARLEPCDIVLVEGFKAAPHPKIECRRTASKERTPMLGTIPAIAAIAADHAVEEAAVPVFDLDDVAAIASFIIGQADLA